MLNYPEKQEYTADDLVEIIALLRDKQNGCPWDKVQTHTSIRMNFLEEAYEAVDAIDLNDPHLLCEELGDVLMQVALHAQMEAELAHFNWNDVCDGVCRKLIGRHPHVFEQKTLPQGINDWETLKNREKGRVTLAQELESVPAAMPALLRAAKLQKRAARFTPGSTALAESTPAVADAARAVQAAPPGSAEAEQALGQLLFGAVALARAANLDPEQALQRANQQFTRVVLAQHEA
ncbi:MAG: MazG family protein [Gemmiger sp.]|nr:MazG family protein [Gemmiger sp.]